MRITLLVVLAGIIAHSSLTRGQPPAPPPPEPPETSGAQNSADRVLFWTSVDNFVALTDDDLAMWKARGVDGFVVQSQWLKGLGSDQRFTADQGDPLLGPSFRLQRSLRDTGSVDRAKARGMKLYLGFYLANPANASTPLADWFDDTGWRARVLPAVANLAGAARSMGFDGLALDTELYPQAGGVRTASWSAVYKGSKRSPAAVRAQVVKRGREVMSTMLSSYPEVELQVYGVSFPGTWQDFVRQTLDLPSGAESLVHLSFWDGMSSVEGYRAIRFSDAFFYKSPQLPGASWDAANEYNVNSWYALLSRHLSNWSYASSRLFMSPFSWVDSGQSNFYKARSPTHVFEQLVAFRRWGTGGEFLNYTQGLLDFDYRPYLDALRTASTPAVVDREPPTLSVGSVGGSNGRVELSGSVVDNMGVRAVYAPDADGNPVAARMHWEVTGGGPASGWEWQTTWELPLDVPGGTAELSVTAVDIKGLTTTVKVPIGR